MTEWVNEWVNDWVNEWLSDKVSDWVCEWVNAWVSEWLTEWASEWLSEIELVRGRGFQRESERMRSHDTQYNNTKTTYKMKILNWKLNSTYSTVFNKLF